MDPRAERPRSTERSQFRFCPQCATPHSRLEVDDRERPVCTACGFIQYRNPVTGVAAVISEQSVLDRLGEHTTRYGLVDGSYRPRTDLARVLLARRATSYRGRWCLPCGHVEFDEEVREALVREMREETGLELRTGEVVAVLSNFHDPDHQTVGVWFEGFPIGGLLQPGDDVDGLAFFDPRDPTIPLAFPTDRIVLDRLALR